MTWAGVYGIAFPILIMALVPLRQYVIPKLFPASSLRYLDTAEDVEEEIEADREDAETTGSPHPEFGAFVQQKQLLVRLVRRRGGATHRVRPGVDHFGSRSLLDVVLDDLACVILFEGGDSGEAVICLDARAD